MFTSMAFFLLHGCVDYVMSPKGQPLDTAVQDTPPSLEISTEKLELGIVCEFTEQKLFLYNGGGQDLTVQQASLEGQGWQLQTTDFPIVIAPQAEAAVALLSGDGEALLRFETDDPNQQQIEVPLSAIANQPPSIEVITPQFGDEIDLFPVEMTANVQDDLDATEYLLLQWRSNVDGVFGYDAPSAQGVATATWTPYHTSGFHTIQLMVTDSCGDTSVHESMICQKDGYLSSKMSDIDWLLAGSASWSNEQLVFSDTAGVSYGSAFLWPRSLQANSWSMDLRFRVDEPAGFQGFAIVAANAALNDSFLGQSGDCLGYSEGDDCEASGSAIQGWTIEIDTLYQESQDTQSGHVLSLVIDGQREQAQQRVQLPDITAEQWYDLSISIQDNDLTIRLANEAVLSAYQVLGDLDFPAVLGFTTAGGAMTVDDIVATESSCGQ